MYDMCQTMLGSTPYEVFQTIVLTMLIIGLAGPELARFFKGRHEHSERNRD
jgi:hypothetical protein